MLKTRQGKTKNCAKTQRYLRKNGRSLAFDHSPVMGDPKNWGQEMDETRAFAGKDFGRKYYHFILSPDPKDNARLQTLRDISVAWARENYPDRQWVIEYHDDNKSGVLHAHVVLNAYDCVTGAKVHRSDAKCRREARVWNRLKAEAGLTVMPDIATIERERKLTGAELEMRSRGFVPYKDKLRAAIERLAPLSADFTQFKSALAGTGIEVYVNKRGQYVYVPPEDWHGWPCKDVKLGAAYTREHLSEVFAPDLSLALEGTSTLERPDFHLPAKRLGTYADAVEARARGFRQIRVDRLASAVRTLRTEHVLSLADLDVRIAQASASISVAGASMVVLEDAHATVRASFSDVETLGRYDKIWSTYTVATKRDRVDIASRYPEAVQACTEAQARLEDRGIETPEARTRIEGLCYEGLSRIENARAALDSANETLRSLRSARKTVETVNTYHGFDTRLRSRRRTQCEPGKPVRSHRQNKLSSLQLERPPKDELCSKDRLRERKLALDVSRADRQTRTEKTKKNVVEKTNEKER